MIVIVDYGLGNVGAFLNMYKRMNIPARPARTPLELEEGDHILLPGVGAFDHALNLLDESGMRPVLERRVVQDNVPVMGVCVGMQILADTSDEGTRAGFGWIPGRVRSFASTSSARMPLPHMGWNDVTPVGDRKLFAGLEQEARFYFLHSFYFECANEADRAATTDYGGSFASAVHRNNVWGLQFHPEKSHHFGAAALRNFAEL